MGEAQRLTLIERFYDKKISRVKKNSSIINADIDIFFISHNNASNDILKQNRNWKNKNSAHTNTDLIYLDSWQFENEITNSLCTASAIYKEESLSRKVLS